MYATSSEIGSEKSHHIQKTPVCKYMKPINGLTNVVRTRFFVKLSLKRIESYNEKKKINYTCNYNYTFIDYL